MRVVAHDDVGEFAREVMPWIARDPVRTNLIATQLAMRASGDHDVEDGIVLWKVVDDQDAIAGLAVLTPPMPMIITGMPPAAVEAVAAAAKAEGLQRFYGPNAQRLAELAGGDAPISTTHGSGLHRLRRVTPPRDVPGRARFAEPDDAMQAYQWVLDFQRDVGDEEPIPLSHVEHRIAVRGLWLWEDGGRPVSMAAWTKPVHGVVRINLVYTTPDARGRGYASALVAAISQEILDHGGTPILYTDLANPTSNKIYAALGYEKLEEVFLCGISHPVPSAAAHAVNVLARRWAVHADPDSGTVFSAATVWPLLALLADAASGPARAELEAAVGAGVAAGETRSLALELIRALDGIPQVRAALGVWVRDGIPLTEAWSGASVLSDQAALDDWARWRTGGLIDRMPIRIDDRTLLVLAGALAVRTAWLQPFEPGPRDLLFRAGTDLDSVCVVDAPSGPLTRVCVEGTSTVDVHLLLGGGGSRGGGGGSVLADGIRSLSGDFPATTGSRLLAIGGTGPGVTVGESMGHDTEPRLHLSTPAFTVQAGHDLLEHAVLFGLSAACDTGRGHFPGISPTPLAISAARQDAMAAFSAKGFEAAAVTAMGAVAGGLPPHTRRVLQVEVVPPFGFLAVHRPSGLVLTAGWMATLDR